MLLPAPAGPRRTGAPAEYYETQIHMCFLDKHSDPLAERGWEGGCRQRKRLQVFDILKFLCGAESEALMDNDLHCVLLLNVFGSNGNKAR